MASHKEEQSHIEPRPDGDFLVVGIDPSMSSTALTVHRFAKDGKLKDTDYLFFPSNQKQFLAFVGSDKGVVIGVRRGKDGARMTTVRTMLDFPDDASYRIQRFVTIANIIHWFISNLSKNCVSIYVSIEDYALRAMGRVYPIGEFGGLLRSAIFTIAQTTKIPVVFREVDPKSVKLFAGNGNAEKADMFEFYATAYKKADMLNMGTLNFDPSFFLEQDEKVQPKGATKKKVSCIEKSPLADLIDSWWISEVFRVELWVRWGWLDQSTLPTHQLHVLNRVTSSYPVNVLNRPFLRWGKLDA